MNTIYCFANTGGLGTRSKVKPCQYLHMCKKMGKDKVFGKKCQKQAKRPYTNLPDYYVSHIAQIMLPFTKQNTAVREPAETVPTPCAKHEPQTQKGKPP